MGFIVKLWHFARGLEVVTEVPAVTRNETVDRVARAIGFRTVAVVSVTAMLLAVLDAGMLARGFRSVAVWALTVYFALVAFLYAVRWWQLRTHDGNLTEAKADE